MVLILSGDGPLDATLVAPICPRTFADDDCQQSGQGAHPHYPGEVNLQASNGLDDRYLGLRQAKA